MPFSENRRGCSEPSPQRLLGHNVSKRPFFQMFSFALGLGFPGAPPAGFWKLWTVGLFSRTFWRGHRGKSGLKTPALRPEKFQCFKFKRSGKIWAQNPLLFPSGNLGIPSPRAYGFSAKFFPEPPPQKCLAKKGPFSTKFYQKWLGPALGRKFGLKPPFFLGFSFAMCLGTPCA